VIPASFYFPQRRQELRCGHLPDWPTTDFRPAASFEGLGKPIWRLGRPISRMRLKYRLMIDQIRRARSELAAICLRHNVRRLDLFGSAVGSEFDPATSDLDFLVEFGPFPKGGYSEHYFGLIEDLKALFGHPVDLLVARAVRNPYLSENINQTRESLFAAA
jgi:uncharacterized protein